MKYKIRSTRYLISHIFVLCSLFFVLIIACNIPENKVSTREHQKYIGYNVMIFLSPECPLSENYTNTINELNKTYREKGIGFCIVFPGNLYTDQEIRSFIDSFHVDAMYKVDRKKTITNRLGATITPEAFLTDRAGDIVYSGAIDNRAIELGKLRQTISEHYLRDAIESVLSGQSVKIKKTEAVGCIIE